MSTNNNHHPACRSSLGNRCRNFGCWNLRNLSAHWDSELALLKSRVMSINDNLTRIESRIARIENILNGLVISNINLTNIVCTPLTGSAVSLGNNINNTTTPVVYSVPPPVYCHQPHAHQLMAPAQTHHVAAGPGHYAHLSAMPVVQFDNQTVHHSA